MGGRIDERIRSLSTDPRPDITNAERTSDHGDAPDVARLERRYRERGALVGIIGMGYVGLPLMLAAAGAGFRTLGFDINGGRVDELNRGASPLQHIPDDRIAGVIDAGQFAATADFTRLAEPDAMLICVPTPLTRQREPDLSFVEATARDIAASLRPGQLIVLESTTYPGTTREVVKPILEAHRPEVAAATSSSPSAPSARIRATRTSKPRASRRSSAATARPRCDWRWRSTRASSARWCRSPRRKSPKRSS